MTIHASVCLNASLRCYTACSVCGSVSVSGVTVLASVGPDVSLRHAVACMQRSEARERGIGRSMNTQCMVGASPCLGLFPFIIWSSNTLCGPIWSSSTKVCYQFGQAALCVCLPGAGCRSQPSAAQPRASTQPLFASPDTDAQMKTQTQEDADTGRGKS